MARTEFSQLPKPAASQRRGLVQPQQTDCEPCPSCGMFVPVVERLAVPHVCDPALRLLIERGQDGGGE